MAARPRRDIIIAHIESVASRRAAEADRIVATLMCDSWPGGGDRTEPGAREWLRRWQPARNAAAVPSCACAQGACPVCN